MPYRPTDNPNSKSSNARETQFRRIIASLREEVLDQKQRRSNEEASPTARQLSEAGIGFQDAITHEVVTATVAAYDEAVQGYDRGEWGTTDPATTGRVGTPPSGTDGGWGLSSWGTSGWGQ